MNKRPRHRPKRSFPNAKRIIVECELEKCIHCGKPLVSGKTWHMRKHVQTLAGPLFVAGKSKKCANPACSHTGEHYHASEVLKISLPYSTYGLDVLAFIGWQHEQEHKQLVEIQKQLNHRGVMVNERNVGKLYRQFLALLGGLSERAKKRLEETAEKHGGLIWGIDALQPEGHGTLLYVLYEVLSGTPVDAIQADYPTADELVEWLQPYRELPYQVLATLSDGEDRIIAALKRSWPTAPHQRCQEHVLGNLAEPVLEVDTQLRKRMRKNLGGLPAVPTQPEPLVVVISDEHFAVPTPSASSVMPVDDHQPAVPTPVEPGATEVSDRQPTVSAQSELSATPVGDRQPAVSTQHKPFTGGSDELSAVPDQSTSCVTLVSDRQPVMSLAVEPGATLVSDGQLAVSLQSALSSTPVNDYQPAVSTQLVPFVTPTNKGQFVAPTQSEPSATPVSEGQFVSVASFLPTLPGRRDRELMTLEAQLRVAVRDAVNRPSRKPFYWGGLRGYRQLQAISQVLRQVPLGEPETGYLQRLALQVARVVEKNHILAQDVREAHTWLRCVADCLRYPPAPAPDSDLSEVSLTGEQVKREMEALLQEFQPDLKRRPAQAALYHAWHRIWEDCGSDWLPCYDIPGLPPDNLQLESLFGRLRNHQRRINGRKSTRELRDFGQFQVLFLAKSEEDLLEQLRQVPLAEYQAARRRLAEAEAPRQFLRRLHRDPLRTIRSLVDQHAARRAALAPSTGLSPPGSDN